MANPIPNNAGEIADESQTQMRRDDILNRLSEIGQGQGQSPNFLQETGTQVKHMAQGAAEVGKGAAQGAVSLARGAALGAANMAQGAADAVKNTLGINAPGTTNNAGMDLPIKTTGGTNLSGITSVTDGTTNRSNTNHQNSPDTHADTRV